MKTIIFYFSSTGNSLQLSREIAASLGDTDILSIPKAMKNMPDLSSYDRIGFVFPVHIWGL
ncbi:MAG: flavodoxin domain-containing protein, partial [bacterium]